MPPIVLLFVLLILTGAAWFTDRRIRGRGQAIYREIALAGGMHYSPSDPLRLTPRVAAHFPVPGAAAVRVIDLLYRTDEQHHYYVFTAEYTIGVVGPKHRVRRAASFIESKSTGLIPNQVRLGPSDLPLVEQYRSLIADTSTFVAH
jgi:hypothetical protein